MPDLQNILTEQDIQDAVARLAQQISNDYRKSELIMIGVLKGAFIFLADLVRHLQIPVKIDFIYLSSYESGTAPSGNVRINKELGINITDKDVLIVEDIVDTGLSMKALMNYLEKFKPKSMRICALIDKRERRWTDIDIHYAGHVIEKGFLVGYGIDWAEDYRYLPAIYRLKS